MEYDAARIRESLHSMLMQAEIDFDLWQSMRMARENKNLNLLISSRYLHFYSSAENTFFNSLVAILYALFENRDDTVNFWSLRKTFPPDACPEFVQGVNQKFSEIKIIWKRICVIRNEVVGHQTLKRTKSQSHELSGLTIKDLQDMITLCQDLLFDISGELHNVHMLFNIRGKKYFENLIDDICANLVVKMDLTKDT
ncbi:hypothetical protein GCM10027046_03690 [Uliginosibacterium flavum]|uniref:HEPN AbiU2-like domain-containing protein n=1 Tax=Uliginosibacterium flavum TaxID=1396831 RepID=A0ABV2TLM0_9RHOO